MSQSDRSDDLRWVEGFGPLRMTDSGEYGVCSVGGCRVLVEVLAAKEVVFQEARVPLGHVDVDVRRRSVPWVEYVEGSFACDDTTQVLKVAHEGREIGHASTDKETNAALEDEGGVGVADSRRRTNAQEALCIQIVRDGYADVHNEGGHERRHWVAFVAVSSHRWLVSG